MHSSIFSDGYENGQKWDPSGKNMFDFALKWDYNVEKYWFCREKMDREECGQLCGRNERGKRHERGNSDLHPLYGGGKTRVKKHNAFLSEGSFEDGRLSGRERITDCGKVTKTALNSYLLFLEKRERRRRRSQDPWRPQNPFSAGCSGEGKIRRDPADSIHAPKIEKKVPVILTVDEVTKLFGAAVRRESEGDPR